MFFDRWKRIVPWPGKAAPLPPGSDAIAAESFAFSRDYTTCYAQGWSRVLGELAGRPHIRAMEIGVYEGRSTLWFLDHILTAPSSRILCIDPVPKPLFSQVLRARQEKIDFRREPSQTVLRDPNLAPGAFHFIYIDGDHSASCVLEDAVLSLPLLRIGGILILDDYRWQSATPDKPLTMPKPGIDAFCNVYCDQISVLHWDRQVILGKRKKDRG